MKIRISPSTKSKSKRASKMPSMQRPMTSKTRTHVKVGIEHIEFPILPDIRRWVDAWDPFVTSGDQLVHEVFIHHFVEIREGSRKCCVNRLEWRVLKRKQRIDIFCFFPRFWNRNLSSVTDSTIVSVKCTCLFDPLCRFVSLMSDQFVGLSAFCNFKGGILNASQRLILPYIWPCYHRTVLVSSSVRYLRERAGIRIEKLVFEVIWNGENENGKMIGDSGK